MAKWRKPNFVEGTYGDIFPRNMGGMMRVEELGNGRAISTFFNNLDKVTKKAVYGAMVDWGQIYHRAIKQTILSNGAGIPGGWEPLNKKYSESKTQYKGQFYRYSTALFKAIILQKDARLGRVVVTVNPDPSIVSHGSDHLSASQIAHILEMGTSKIPARPLFKPAWKMMGGNSAFTKYAKEQLRLSILISAKSGN